MFTIYYSDEEIRRVIDRLALDRILYTCNTFWLLYVQYSKWDPGQGLYLKGERTGPTEGAPKGEVGGAMPPQVAPR